MSRASERRAAMAAVRAQQRVSSGLVDTFTQHTRPVANELLAEIARTHLTSGSSESRAAEAPAGNPADAGANPAPTTDGGSSTDNGEDPMPKIQFQSILLLHDAPRHDGGRGRASSETTSFDRSQMKDIVIELDTATRLVRISKGAVACYIPESGVKRFGPTLEDFAAQQAQYDAAEAKSREDNERAARESAARAAQPAL